MVAGQLEPFYGETIEWTEMGRVEKSFGNELPDLFGLKCEPCSSAYIPLTYGSGPDQCENWILASWEREQYYLLQFPDEDLDTLLIRDVKKAQQGRIFSFYLNDNE